MARRTDHTPDQLRALLIGAGHEVMTERGFARFSARETASRAGYTVGTIYHVFGSLDAFLLSINTLTFTRWISSLEAALAQCTEGEDRIAILVRAYFDFAVAHQNSWMAIYDHRRPPGLELNAREVEERGRLTAIVDREVARALDRPVSADSMRLTRSLIATVHGHCVLHLGGSFALMGEADPPGQAISRVHESLAAARLRS